MKVINYRDNPNFTKQWKSTPNMGWLLLWGTRGFLKLEQENHLEKPKTESFIYWYYKMKFSITYIAATINKSLSFLTLVTHKGPFRIVRTNSVCPLYTFLASNPLFTVVVFREEICTV